MRIKKKSNKDRLYSLCLNDLKLSRIMDFAFPWEKKSEHKINEPPHFKFMCIHLSIKTLNWFCVHGSWAQLRRSDFTKLFVVLNMAWFSKRFALMVTLFIWLRTKAMYTFILGGSALLHCSMISWLFPLFFSFFLFEKPKTNIIEFCHSRSALQFFNRLKSLCVSFTETTTL